MNPSAPQSSMAQSALVLVDQGENKLESNMKYKVMHHGPLPGPQIKPTNQSTFKQNNWTEGNVGAAGVYDKVSS